MKDTHKNAHQNVYKTARLYAVKYNPLFSSMDTAPELIFISRQTLFSIESGKSTPSAETALRMSKAYHSPELLPYFCSVECPVGKARGFQATKGIRTEGSALHIISLLAKSEFYTKSLVEAAKDGEIDEHERESVNSIISWINELNHYKDELINAVEKGNQGKGE